MLKLVRWLQALDRRVIYVLVLLVLSTPFVFAYTLPIYPDTYTKRFYDEIERIAADPVEREKVVLFLTNWGPGTRGENEPQFDVLVRHLLRRRLRFVFVCTMGPPEFHDAAMAAFERAQAAEVQRARRLGQPTPTWVYGEDYLDFGYENAVVFHPVARTVVTEPRAFFQQDHVNRKDLTDDASYPLLRRFHGVEDISAVLVVSAGDESKYIAGLVKSEYPDLKIGPATMGIVANNLYPFVKSNQLFGLINSARGASEYRALLNPDEPTTTAKDNSMSFGKGLLLLLVLLGNAAFLVTRWGERTGRLPALDKRTIRPPLPPLPKRFMWSLFIAFGVFYAGSAVYDLARFMQDRTLARVRLPRADDDPAAEYPAYERVGRETLRGEVQAEAARSPNPLLAKLADREADQRFAKLIENRVGEFIAAFLTLGVFAFLLGDNRFYRFIEAIIMGGSMAYLLDQVDKILRPKWFEPIVEGLFDPEASWTGVLWVLLLLPGALWYFTYSRKYRWLNQVIVAVFIGLMVAPEFKNQTNLIIPQVLNTIQPVWPWVTDPQTGMTVFESSRLEHLVFVVVAVLSLLYFIFFFRPKTKLGRGTIAASRLTLMVGFGVGFGNTVNTRLAWLAGRVAFLLQDWLGKLFGA